MYLALLCAKYISIVSQSVSQSAVCHRPMSRVHTRTEVRERRVVRQEYRPEVLIFSFSRNHNISGDGLIVDLSYVQIHGVGPALF